MFHGCAHLDIASAQHLDWSEHGQEEKRFIDQSDRRPTSRLCMFTNACFNPADRTIIVHDMPSLKGISAGGTVVSGHRWRQELRVKPSLQGKRLAAAINESTGLVFYHSWTSYFHVMEAAMGIVAAAHLISRHSSPAINHVSSAVYMAGEPSRMHLARLFSALLGVQVGGLTTHSQPVCHARLVVGYPAQVLHSAHSARFNSMPTSLVRHFQYTMYRVHGLAHVPSSAATTERVKAGALIVHRAHGRGIANEEELLAAFGRLAIGARSVDFASIAVREQVQLMARSRYLVGMSGAGMSNAIFLPTRASVFLLKPHQYYGQYLDGFLSTLGLDWECWQPPSGELQWTAMDAKRCQPGNKAFGEAACTRDQVTTMDVRVLPGMVHRAQGPQPSARACQEVAPPREQLACFQLCFPQASTRRPSRELMRPTSSSNPPQPKPFQRAAGR